MLKVKYHWKLKEILTVQEDIVDDVVTQVNAIIEGKDNSSTLKYEVISAPTLFVLPKSGRYGWIATLGYFQLEPVKYTTEY